MCKIFTSLLIICVLIIHKSFSLNQKNDFTFANFHLKWVYDDYLLPIHLEKRIDSENTNEYKWYKYSEKAYIDDINDQAQEYLTLRTKDTTKLSILEYNFTTHEQLSSYEPKVVNDLMQDYKPISQDYSYDFLSENLTDIFTIVYMKSHSLVLNRLGEKTDVSCVVKVMMPINAEFINEKNFNLLQKFLYIRIGFSETKRPGLIKLRRGKNKRKQRFKRKVNKKRIIPTTFIEVELKEGPFTVLTKDFKSNNVTCTLGLVDYDDTIPFEETIFELINDLTKHPTNKGDNKDDNDYEVSNETDNDLSDSYDELFTSSEFNLNFSPKLKRPDSFIFALLFVCLIYF